jgi:hypothetical protein
MQECAGLEDDIRDMASALLVEESEDVLAVEALPAEEPEDVLAAVVEPVGEDQAAGRTSCSKQLMFS